MKTYLLVNVALLSLPLYLLGAWLFSPVAGAAVAFAYALGWSLVTRGPKMPPVFEAALMAGLFLVLADRILNVRPLIGAPTGIVLLCLSVGAAWSVAMGKPWTAAFSAAEYGGASRTPLFLLVNMIMSAFWAVLFAWLGVAVILDLPAIANWLPAAFGALVSIVLPRAIVAFALKQGAKGDRRNNWAPPDFSGGLPDTAEADEVCDVAVVGAGIGGLTAAALLTQAGLNVRVFEQHVVPGGFAHTWLRRARLRDPQTGKALVFRFDSGVHDVSGWHPGGPVRAMFERLGIAGDCRWERLDHRYTLAGRTISVSRDWRAYAADLAAAFPQEADGIKSLFEDIHDVYRATYANADERAGVPGAPTTPEGLLAFADAHPLAVAWMDRPWTEFVARHVTSPEALEWIDMLTDYVTDDPQQSLVSDLVPLFGYYFNGGYYPVGGSGVLGESLAAAVEKYGGSVHLRTTVRRIVEENGAAAGLVVRDVHGAERRIRARAVICNGDLRLMLDGLLENTSIADRLEAQTGAVRPACSAMAVHLGLRGALDLPPVIHVDGEDGGVGMIMPSVVDPTCAPDGYATLELLRLIPHDEAKDWFAGCDDEDPNLAALRRSGAYRDRKRKACDAMVACARQIIPDLDERIVYRADASPVTFRRYTHTADGAIYGVRAKDDTVPVKTPLRNLALAGAATHGPGIEAVVISGAYAAEALLPGLLAAVPETDAGRQADNKKPEPAIA